MTAKAKTKAKKPARKRKKPEVPSDLFSTISLSEELGVNRHTIRKYLHGEEPDLMEGATKFWSLARVRKILSERSKALNATGESATQGKAQAEVKRINLQAEKLEIEIKKMRRELTDTGEFKEFLGEFMGKLRRILDRKLEMEFPKLCAGLTLQDIRKRGKQLNDEILAMIKETLEHYDTEEYEG